MTFRISFSNIIFIIVWIGFLGFHTIYSFTYPSVFSKSTLFRSSSSLFSSSTTTSASPASTTTTTSTTSNQNKMNEDKEYEELMKLWRAGYVSCNKEVCVQINDTTIPKDLIGTYFKNGHAKFEIGKDKVLHPFDADGMIIALSINHGNILFRNKYVRTKGFVTERSANKQLFRNSFGTQKPGGILANIFDVNIKNVANTNVLYGGGRLLALWEGGLPHLLEPDSLRTQSEYTFKGLLNKGDGFSAHPRLDSKTGHIVSFAVKKRDKSTKIEVYEFGKDLELIKTTPFEVPGFVFFHDFVITENYYLFNQAPLSFDPLPFILGFKTAADCIDYDSSKSSTLYMIPRNGKKTMETIMVDPHFNFHFANAYEENNKIIFDVIWTDTLVLGEATGKSQPIWETVDYQNTVPYYSLMRYTLTKNENDNNWSYEKQKLNKNNLDFPSVNPMKSAQKHRYIYSSVSRFQSRSSPICGLLKLDTETGIESKWFGLPYEIIQEPVIVSKTNGKSEDDVYVIALLHNTKEISTEFVVFEGQDIEQGPISQTKLPIYIPYGLHGQFVPGLVYNPEDVIRRWIACNALESKSWNKMNGGFSGLGLSYDFNDSK